MTHFSPNKKSINKMIFHVKFLLIVIVIFYSFANSHPRHEFKKLSVEWNPSTNQYSFIYDKIAADWVAWGTFSDQTHENGWNFLKVVTNSNFPDEIQAYAAGLVEGRLTTKLMGYTWNNYVKWLCDELTGSSVELCEMAWQFLRINKDWTMQQIIQFSDTEPYWHQVNLMYNQIKGIQDGCIDHSFISNSDNALFQEFGFWLFTVNFDVAFSIFAKYNETLHHVNDHPGACSVLIKPLPRNADLYVAHDTWFFYTTMVRILKNYEFYYHLDSSPESPIVPGYNITFSSYPGSIQSGDDYYLISSGLVTLETTINLYNDSLLEFIQPESVLEGFRVMLANRLAKDGESWVFFFSEFNSGTYNNQWMVVNYNLFTPGNDHLSDGLLWVVEQIPGYCESADVTPVLRRQGYWASYNIPYFETIFNMTEQKRVIEKYGAIFGSYNGYFRAQMFKHKEGTVVDIKSMIKVMRFNDYQNDPYSVCVNCTPKHNAMMAIAPRGDLNPANGTYYPFSIRHMDFGATDMKLTNYSMFQTLQFIAYGGPTYDQQPPFQWSKYNTKSMHVEISGQPDVWKFLPILTVWN